MPQLIAVHEIHRPGKGGKPEVITPGKAFKATEAEMKQLVEVFGAARLPLEEDRLPASAEDEDGGSTETKPEELNMKDLVALAKKLEITVPKGIQQSDLLKLVQDKLAADGGLI